MSTLTEIDALLNQKRAEFRERFPIKAGAPFSAEDLLELNRRNDEMTDLSKQRDALIAVEANNKALVDDNRPAGAVSLGSGQVAASGNGLEPLLIKQLEAMGLVMPKPRKSLGDMVAGSDAFKNFNTRQRGSVAGVDFPDLDFKATFTVSGATLTGYERPPGIVLVEQQRLTVADLLASGTTTQNTIRYVKEDTFTNAATTVAENSAKPEASFDTSEVDAPVRKIAVIAKVTDELFADFPMLRDYINNRLVFMVGVTEEAQLLTGDGNAPNITGILQTANILTQAKGADPVPDAIFKAMTKIMTQGFFDPTGVVMHPNDWQDVRLLRTVDGIYIWGNPSEAGPERIFGLPVVITTAMTENTALVGAFRLGAQIWRREGIRVESTNSNEADFKSNLIAIRVEERLALTVYRPKAFCTVTGV